MDLVIAVLIVIAVQLVMFLYLRGKIHQELNATTLLKDVQDEVDGMVRELNLSAERNIGLLEARIEELETLLAQSDQKLVLLAREVERKEKASEVYTQLKRVSVPPPPPGPEAEPEPEPEPVDSPVVEWKPAPPRPGRPGADPAPEPEGTGPGPPRPGAGPRGRGHGHRGDPGRGRTDPLPEPQALTRGSIPRVPGTPSRRTRP